MLIMRIHRAAGELREAKWLQWCDDAAIEGGVQAVRGFGIMCDLKANLVNTVYQIQAADKGIYH